ncbi:serine/threonine-protein kinase ICK isoform X2 [Latimeria chalumnae]|uniref:Ciliosis associated kinase 1 n=2 Tax=Latimeria chalumnae TaxID=7897 RepID=H2ZSX5_LATCH|nr:PREDICTED: serine/threonine-protein kinase ICK [Latimeria chalumnae]|eukprot:XP_006013960.2 PREDICTED: serine/threonine-protein kinase ICK [Latimeria chalumnae]
MYQIQQGLAFIHKHGFFHRDMKPENLLCIGPELVKIADFGLAREIRSRPPYTDYVSTRWYRAPEVLLRSTNYSSPIDVWAVGCIMAELYTLRPLFPGSSEVDTIFKICQVLGTPKKNDWPEGYQLASAMNFRWPQCVPNNLKTLIPNASSEAIQLMRDMLQWDPKKRPTASQALRYSYFHVGQALGTPLQIQEQGKKQKELLQKQVPFHLKPVPPPQPPPQHHSHPSTRPLQQIQSLQHQINQHKLNPSTDLVDNKSKLQEQDRILPAINAKTLHLKVTATSENTNGTLKSSKPKDSRRRWGHITKVIKSSDDWDDFEDLDLNASLIPTNLKNDKKQQSEEALCRFESLLDLKPMNKEIGNSIAVNNSFPRHDTAASRTSSAKQHYLKQSRYLPGLSTKDNMVSNPSKEFAPWASTSLPGKTLGVMGGAMPVNRTKAGHISGGGLSGDYVPSFLKKEVGSAGQRVQLAPLGEPSSNKYKDYTSWKPNKPQMGVTRPSLSLPSKTTARLMPRPPPVQPIHGRTDWSSKYGGHR